MTSDPIDIHADDYALTVNTSKEMLALIKDGILDSISIVPNNSCYSSCISMLKAAIPTLPFLPKMSVHINLVEGFSLSSADNSLIRSSWGSLLIDSFKPIGRASAGSLIKEEISAQISRVWPDIQECIDIASRNGITSTQTHLRVDSHQHTHMIPIVWDALIESISENGWEVEYIRNSNEPLWEFVSYPALWTSYRPVNLIKNRILHFFSGRPDKYDKMSGRRRMYMWGLVMSGKMDRSRISILYPALYNKATRDDRSLEILFHPGRMTADEGSSEIPGSAAAQFYLSPNRDIEKQGAIFCRGLNNRAQTGPVQSRPK